MKKSAKLSIIAFAAVISSAAALASCKNNQADYVIPENTEIEAGFAYTPDFRLAAGVKATLKSLEVPYASKTTADGLSFTPDVTGVYTYTVKFVTEKGSEEKIIEFRAVDTTAPAFGALENRTAEIGFYSDLGKDVETAAEKVTDNCAKTVAVYPESVSYGGKTKSVGKDDESVFLPSVGEYTVKLVAEDFSGNKAYAEYKINAKDSVDPVIESPEAVTTWAIGGKAKLPEVNVVEHDLESVTLTVKDGSGNDVTVQNGYITAGTGSYDATYVARDRSGNESSATVRVIVKEKGIINDFSAENETYSWSGSAVRAGEQNMRVLSSEKSETTEYSEFFLTSDWSDYKKFSLKAENHKGAPLTVSARFLTDKGWEKAGYLSLAPAAIDDSDFVGVTPSQGVLEIYTEDFGFTEVRGIKLDYACESGIDARIDDIILSASDDRTFPDVSALSGFGAGRYDLAAKGSANITGNKLTSSANAVKMTVFSSAEANARIVLRFGDVATSVRYKLKKGENDLVRLPDKETGESGLLSSGLTGIDIYNEEDFGVTLFMTGVRAESVTSLAVSDYAETAGYGLSYGDGIAAPYPFKAHSNYVSDVSAALYKGGTLVKNLEIGEKLTASDSALGYGKYEIRYSYKDAFGSAKTLNIGLTVEKKILEMSVNMPALFLGDGTTGVELPAPALSSEVYSDLNNVQVTRYYREKGKTIWREATSENPFAPNKSRTYELRYVAEKDGTVKELTFSKFIHRSPYVIDFEEEQATNENCYIGYDENNNNLYDKGRFLYDGGYYDYNPKNNMLRRQYYADYSWKISGARSFSLDPDCNGWFGIQTVDMPEKTVNAVKFYLKAILPASDGRLELGTTRSGRWPGGWLTADPFEIEQGVKQYFVFLTREVNLKDVTAFTLKGYFNNRFYLDDIEFVYVNRLSAETPDYEDVLDKNAPFDAGSLTLDSEYYSAEQLKNADVKLYVSVNGGEEQRMKKTDGIVFGESGDVKIKWIITMPDGYALTVEKEIYSGIRMSAANKISGFVGEELEVAAPTAAYALSDVTAEYRAESESEWKPVENGKFTPTEKGDYYIRYSATADVDGKAIACDAIKTIYIRKGLSTIDFEPMEGREENYGYGRGYDSVAHPTAENSPKTQELSSDYSHSGRYSMKLNFTQGYWRGFENLNVKLEKKKYNMVEFYAYAPVDINVKGTFDATVYVDGTKKDVWTDQVVSFKAGWHLYRYELTHGLVEFEDVFAVTINISTYNVVAYIDDIRFLVTEFSKPIESAEVATEYELPKLILEDTEITAKYRKQGDTEWIQPADNKAVFASTGDYEFGYEYTEGSFLIYTMKVTPPAVAGVDEAIAAKRLFAVGEELVLPTSEEFDSTVKYAIKGGEYADAEGGKITFAEAGIYYILYTFTSKDGSASFDKTYTVKAKEAVEGVIMDFQAGDGWCGGSPYTQKYAQGQAESIYEDEGGDRSLHIEGILNSWGGLTGLNISLGKKTNKLRITYTSDKTYDYGTELIWIAAKLDGVNKSYYSTGFKAIEEGTHTVEITFTGEFDTLTEFTFYINNTAGYRNLYIDDIAVV